jgi:type I restriction enzyme M protein
MISEDDEDVLSDPLCRYYSLPHVSELLVKTMPSAAVSSIVDLGAGNGTLSDAAVLRWADATVTTVDLDATCGVARRSPDALGRRMHYTLDALDPEITSKLSFAGNFDAALCNPPFRRIRWREGYDRVLSEAGLDRCFSSKGDVTAEALFLAQNMRLVRRGGSIGLVVPDSFVSGTRARALRKNLLERHSVRAVVQLPPRSFSKTEARSFLLVLENRGHPGTVVHLHKFSLQSGLSEAIALNPVLGEHRLDYDFHLLDRNGRLSTLASLGADIKRGRLTASESRTAREFVFHTTDYASIPDPGFVGPCHTTDFPSAKPGDILLARVDRQLETKVTIVLDGQFAVSDCIFIVRVPALHRQRVYSTLRSELGRKKLKAISRGVGARHISKSELLHLPLF